MFKFNRPIFNSDFLPRWTDRFPIWSIRIIFALCLLISPIGWPVLFLIDEASLMWNEYKAEVRAMWQAVIGHYV